MVMRKSRSKAVHRVDYLKTNKSQVLLSYCGRILTVFNRTTDDDTKVTCQKCLKQMEVNID